MSKAEKSSASAGSPGAFSGAALMLPSAAGFFFAAQSALGIAFPGTVYPTSDLYNAFLPNDYVNLFFGVPVLIVSLVLALRKSPLGLIGVCSSLLFILYNSAAYLFALSNPYGLALSAIVTALCAAALIPCAVSLRKAWQAAKPAGIRRPKLSGGILTAMGLVFVGRALASIAEGGSAADVGVNAADAILCSLWVISGFLLLAKKPNGVRIAAAAVCVLHGSLLFAALILFMLLQPLLCTAAFAAADLLAITLMGLVMIVPCVLLLRGIAGGTGKR